MDFGDIILGIVDVGILVGIFVSFYQMICTKKRIKTNGCKAALKKLLLCEGYLLAIGIIQLWVVFYPPFVITHGIKFFPDGWKNLFGLKEESTCLKR